jgi:hypothetical protein
MSADNQQERPRNQKLQPWYIVGFVEGEGTFHVAFYQDRKMQIGWKVIPEFHINQGYIRKNILEAIMHYFSCGYLKPNHANKSNDDTWVYVVRNKKDLKNKIIPFFKRYPLLSRKKEDFLLFNTIIDMTCQGNHLNKDGFKKIVTLAYQMNAAGRYRKTSFHSIIDSLESSETIRQAPIEKLGKI